VGFCAHGEGAGVWCVIRLGALTCPALPAAAALLTPAPRPPCPTRAQVQFWGHPISAGTGAIDYFVSSQWDWQSDSEHGLPQSHFNEQLVLLEVSCRCAPMLVLFLQRHRTTIPRASRSTSHAP